MLNSMLVVTTALAGQVVAGGPTYPDGLDILRGADTLPQVQLILDSSCSMNDSTGTSPNCPYFDSIGALVASPFRTFNPANYRKIDLLKAAMTGCGGITDGILDLPFASRALFALRLFGTSGVDGLTTNGGYNTAGGNLNGIQNDILSMTPQGGTPLAQQYYAGAQYQTDFFRYSASGGSPCASPTTSGATGCNNTLQCRQNYLVVMSDGSSNGTAVNNWQIGSLPQLVDPIGGGSTIRDLNGSAPHTDVAAAYMVDADLATPVIDTIDVDADVDGNQDIRTYTVAFDAGAAAEILLDDMATAGLGQAFTPTTYGELANAFQTIILSVIARSNVAFSPGTLQNDGLFSGNYVYVTSFRPFDRGSWHGTTKKYCVDPQLLTPANPGSAECMFLRQGGSPTGALLANPTPMDIWTLTATQDANVGGTGAVMPSYTFADPMNPTVIPGAPYGGRNIMTWAPGTPGWIPITGPRGNPGTFNPTFTNTSGWCQHAELVNKLFGYTAEAVGASGCSTVADSFPVAVDQWPIGDTINGSTILIRYADNCQAAGNCYLAVNSNEGMLHFYDAANGREISAVIPGHLWSDNLVNTHQLRDIMDQPTLDEMRRYYFDGKGRLYHDDRNGDGNINNGETAYLIFGLGRGGRQYLKFDVSANFLGNAASLTPQALSIDDQQSSLRHLRETWAPMWVGNFREVDTQSVVPTGIIVSGHDREDDINTTTFGQLQSNLPPGPSNAQHNDVCSVLGISAAECSLGGAINAVCTALETDPVLNPLGFVIPPATRNILCNPAQCQPCNAGNGYCTSGMTTFLTDLLADIVPFYNSAAANATAAQKPCYDWSGWSAHPGSPLSGNGSGSGYTIPLGPFQFSSGNGGKAYRVRFSGINMQANDYVSVTDSTGNEVIRYTGNVGPAVTPWIYDTNGFRLNVVTDGIDDAAASGWTIASIDYQTANITAPSPGQRMPTVYFVDLNTFNYNGLAAAPAAAATTFNDLPTNNQQEGAILARVTYDCSDSAPVRGVCLDRTTHAALANFTCPISAEPTVYREGGLFRTAYIGDECGQIWAIERAPSTAPGPGGFFNVRRIAHLNNDPLPPGDSKDFRKIFTKLDVAISTCTGARRFGVYFGTGNTQRPALDLYLRNAAISTPGIGGWFAPIPGPDLSGGAPDVDVYGVIWDDGSSTTDLGLQDLYDATAVTQVDYSNAAFASQTTNGWFVQLAPDEKVLRNPLVIDGVAYFKTYEPLNKATECVSATGIDSVYAVDNCNAAPLGDQNGVNGINSNDRRVWQGNTDIGGDLLLYTPADGPPVITTGTPEPGAAAQPMLPARQNRRAVRLYMWRLQVDPSF